MTLKIISIFITLLFHLTYPKDIFPKSFSDTLLEAESRTGISKVIEMTQNLIQSDIQKVEKKVVKDIPVWKVITLTQSGGMIKFEFKFNEIELLQIDSEEGPFDYDLIPKKEFLSFATAKSTAEKHSGLKILKWSLKEIKQNWEYSFWVFTKSGKAHIRVNALSGEIIVKKSKK